MCFSPATINLIRSMMKRCAVDAPLLGGKRSAFRVFVGTPEGKSLLGNPSVGGKVIFIRMISKRVCGCAGVEWIHLAEGMDHWRPVMKLRLTLLPEGSL